MINREEYLERIKRFRLLDDTFMKKVFADKDCANLLLRILLERDDLSVSEVKTQNELKNLNGRSVVLDIYATDEAGNVYNVEVQRAKEGANPFRARYHSAMIDGSVLDPGEDFTALPETYVIFVTETDVLRAGLPMYHVERIIRETGEYFADKAHILYVNGSYQGTDPVGLLMQDFRETEPERIHYDALRKTVRHFKESQEGRNDMCQIMEELRDEALKEGQEKTIIANIRSLMESLSLTLDAALKALRIPQDKWEHYASIINGK